MKRAKLLPDRVFSLSGHHILTRPVLLPHIPVDEKCCDSCPRMYIVFCIPCRKRAKVCQDPFCGKWYNPEKLKRTKYCRPCARSNLRDARAAYHREWLNRSWVNRDWHNNMTRTNYHRRTKHMRDDNGKLLPKKERIARGWEQPTPQTKSLRQLYPGLPSHVFEGWTAKYIPKPQDQEE